MSLEGSLVVDFWDVGQGDASVITLPSGELIIIDTGEDPCLQKWLRRRKPKIHTIVITHNDSDHCGTLNAILNDYQGPAINLWIVNDQHKSTAALRELFASLPRHFNNRKILPSVISVQGGAANQPIYHSPCGNIKLDIVFPPAAVLMSLMAKSNPNPNTVSAILTLTLEETIQVVWAGDAPMAAVAHACRGMRPKVLVGPHHGGPIDRPDGHTSQEMADAYRNTFQEVFPERVFISVGTDNTYSHPIKTDFIDQHRLLNRHVICSQLHHCGRKQVKEGRSLLGNHGAPWS